MPLVRISLIYQSKIKLIPLSPTDHEESSDDSDEELDEDTVTQEELDKLFEFKYTIAAEKYPIKNEYILHLASDRSYGRLAAGYFESGQVKIFDLESSSLSETNTLKIPIDNDGYLCGVKFVDDSPHNMLVGQASGEISLYDLRTNNAEHSFSDLSREEQRTKPITCFDLNCNSRVICAGTEQIFSEVYLLFFDLRMQKLKGAYWESHQDDITQVRFHPTNPDRLVTGSTDGLLNTFDLTQDNETDALKFTMNSESSVQRLNWHTNPFYKDYISCITDMNELLLFDGDQDGELFKEYSREKIANVMRRSSASYCNVIQCHELQGSAWVLAQSNYNKGEIVRTFSITGKKLTPFGQFDGNKQIIRESIVNPQVCFLILLLQRVLGLLSF